MGQQSVRQAARREVMEALAARRRERAEQEKRLEDLGVQVAAALMERDAAVIAAERRAGQALQKMTEVEGLSVREALAWCGEPVSMREATRLVKVTGIGQAALEPAAQEPAAQEPAAQEPAAQEPADCGVGGGEAKDAGDDRAQASAGSVPRAASLAL